MEKYYTAKEIIMGLREEFIKRNQFLLEMKKLLVPLDKKLTFDVTLDDMSKSVELEAYYNNPTFLQAWRMLFSKKYVYSASLLIDKDHIFKYEPDDQGKIFPINFGLDTYIELEKIFKRLMNEYYDISLLSDIVYSYYNSLVIYNNKKGLDFSIIDYNPKEDELNISTTEEIGKNEAIEMLNQKYPKELLSDRARECIESNPNTYKEMVLATDQYDKTLSFDICEYPDQTLLVRKLKK